MEFECRTKLMMAPTLFLLKKKVLNFFLFYFLVANYVLREHTAYSNSYYFYFNTTALYVQICIIQPTICEQLENADNRANVAPGFYFAIQLGIHKAKHIIFFLLHYHCKSLKGYAELSLIFQEVLGD